MGLWMCFPFAYPHIAVIDSPSVDLPAGTVVPHGYLRGDGDSKFAGHGFVVIFPERKGEMVVLSKSFNPFTCRGRIGKIADKSNFLGAVGLIEPR